MDSIAQVNYVEIDEQSYGLSAQLQIRNDLRLEDRVPRFDTLQFDDDQVLNQQVDAVSQVKCG